MHHLIYLPPSFAHLELSGLGLSDHAPGAQRIDIPGDQQVTAAHSGGTLIAWSSRRPRINELTELTWLPAMPLDDLPAARYLVGIDDDHPPQPHELLKDKAHSGEPVALGDGHLWVVPHAAELPFDIVRDSLSGEIQQVPREAFYRFWTRALSWQRRFDGHQQGQPLPDLTEQVEFLEESLRLNYRLTPEVITALKLFSTGPEGTLRACLAACLHVEPEAA